MALHRGRAGAAQLPGRPGRGRHRPRRTLHDGGHAVCDLMSWVPQSGHLGLGVSILSYADAVQLGIASDAGLVPDPGSASGRRHRAAPARNGDHARTAPQPAAVRGVTDP